MANSAQTRFAVVAVQKFRRGEPIHPRERTRQNFGPHLALIDDWSTSLAAAMAGNEDEAAVLEAMEAYWLAVREDPQYRDLVAAVDAADIAEAAEPWATAARNGHPQQTQEIPLCPPLLPHDEEDEELIARVAAEASPWLDRYIEVSRRWAPRAFDEFHEACGLFVLSTTAARRIRIELGQGVYPSLYQALVSRTTLFSKTTAAAIALGLLRQAGLSHLLSPDDATPPAFLRSLVARIPDDYEDLSPEKRERVLLQLAFAAQRGWFYEEFGQHLSAMMSLSHY